MAIFAVGERYLDGAGLLYRLDPCVKIVATVLFAFGVTLVPPGHWSAFAGFGLFVALCVAVSGVSPPRVLRRSMLALPFVVVALPLAFTRDGDTLFTVPWLGWTASREGSTAVASILLKSWLTVIVAVVLTAVTRPLELIRGLERLRLPRVLVATVLFMYRYIFVIGEEAHRLMRARDARSAAVHGRGGRSIAWRARVLGNMVGSLFIRSYERSERIYAAMQARGYDGTIRFAEVRRMTRHDQLALLLVAVVITGLTIYARL